MLKHLLKGTATLTVSTIIVIILSAGFYLIAHLIPSEQFSLIVSVISFINIFVIVQNTLQTYISSTVAKQEANISLLLKSIINKALKPGILITLILILFAIFVFPTYFNTQNIPALLVIPVSLIAGFLISLVRGVLAGKKKFFLLGSSQVLETFIKTGLALLLAASGFGVSEILWGLILASLISLLYSYLVSRKIISSDHQDKFPHDIKFLGALGVTMILLHIILNLDGIIMRNVLVEQSAIYASLVVLSKPVFALSNVAATVLVPLAVKEKNSKSLLSTSLLVSSGVGVILILGYILFGRILVNLVFGEQYLNALQYLPLAGITMILFAIVYQISIMAVIKGKRFVIVTLIVAMLSELITLQFFAKDIFWFVFSQFLILLFALVLIGGYYLKQRYYAR